MDNYNGLRMAYPPKNAQMHYESLNFHVEKPSENICDHVLSYDHVLYST